MILASARTLLKQAILGNLPGCLVRGPAGGRRIAITFDDGPDPLTRHYLDCLDRLAVPATFFVCGDQAVRRPELIREYARRGHQVGGHGYDHVRFTSLDRPSLLAQCAATDRAIGGQFDRPWVRPPHGALDARSLATLVTAGYQVALWSFDSRDYDERDASSLARRCAAVHLRPGDVMLFHEGQPWTLAALPAIVGELQHAGFELVTMFDLFAG